MARQLLDFRLPHRVAPVEGDADTCGDGRVVPSDVEWNRDRVDEPLCDPRRVFLCSDVFEQDRKLVATQSRDRIGGTNACPQTFGDHAQQFVAGSVPKAVVDALESVEVHEQHRERNGVPTGAGERMLDAILEKCPIR